MSINRGSGSSAFFSVSLFWKIFWSIFIAAIVSASITWFWLYKKVYTTLDNEATDKLKQIAGNVVTIAKSQNIDSFYSLTNPNLLFEQYISFKSSDGWIQNFYWLDMRRVKPTFIASYTSKVHNRSSMAPPSADEAEDLVFDYINELDKGETIYPDADAYGISRKFKIILVPIFDEDNTLESVIGIEADMEYLSIMKMFKGYLIDIFVFSILISLFVSLLFAKNFSGKFGILLGNINKVESGKIPVKENLSVTELTVLNNRLIDMAQKISMQHAELKRVYEHKLEELAFTGAAIAHEVRNPLSAIEMHFGLIKRHMAKHDIKEHESVEEISNQFTHLRTLVTNFLTYSRKVEPQKELFLLYPFIESAIKNKLSLVKGFKYELNIEDEYVINFDSTMLVHVVDNILNNAIEACEKDLHIIISASENEGIKKIAFRDNGPGIPGAIFDKLFTPFCSHKDRGNGIGLALVRKLVEAHGGKIYCKNLESGGALFTIEVPE